VVDPLLRGGPAGELTVAQVDVHRLALLVVNRLDDRLAPRDCLLSLLAGLLLQNGADDLLGGDR
jgi:hypothetical protein